MTKVEELRYSLIGSLALIEFLKANRGEIPEASIAEYRKTVELEVADFEAAIHAEGVAEGAAEERERIVNPLVDKHWNSKVDELREGIVGDLTQLAFLGGKHPEMAWGELRHKYANPVVDSFIAACLVQGRAEGAWAEIEFLKQNTRNDISVGRYLPYDNFLHPEELLVSVLAPTEQAKITRLAEIVADMSAEEPPVEITTRAGSVLAPTKESEVVHTKILYSPDEVKK